MNEEIPKITTIIPTYRRPEMLKRAIYSALNQSYENIQVNVHDNNSGDETEKAVKEIIEKDSRVKYFCNKTNVGQIPNFKVGMDNVTTPYFSLLCDDDVMLPRFYEVAMKAFEQYPKIAFFMGGSLRINNKGKVCDASPHYWKNTGLVNPPEGLYELIKQHSNWVSMLFKKSEVPEMDLEGGYLFDYDYILRIASKHSYYFSKEMFSIFFEHKKSFSQFGGVERIYPGFPEIINRVETNPSIPENVKRKCVTYLKSYAEQELFGVFTQDIYLHNFDDAFKACELMDTWIHNKKKSRAMKILTLSTKFFSPTYLLLWGLVKYRIWKRREEEEFVQKEYGHYVRYLE